MAGKTSGFLSASIAGGIQSVVKLGVGFVRVKYIALFLGTAGIGLLSQGNQLTLLSIALGSLSMNVGVITRLSSRIDEAAKRRALATAFTAQLALSLLMLALTLLFPSLVSRLVFGSREHGLKCIAVMAGIPFAVLASGYLEAIMYGAKRYDLFVKASIMATITSLLIFIPLVQLRGLDGAFWAILANGFCLFSCYLVCALRVRPWREIFSFGLDRRELRQLMRYGAVILATGGVGYLVNLLIRRKILIALGASSNGIAQVPLALSAYYTPFLTNPLWGRLHPVAAENGDCAEARHELAVALRYTMLFATGIIVSILLLQETLIKLTYSSAFLEALPLLPIQLLGDAFYFVGFTYGVYYLGTSNLRLYLFGWITYYGGLAALSSVLLGPLGLRALPSAHLATSTVLAALAVTHWLVRRSRERAMVATLAIVACCVGVIVVESLLTFSGASFAARAVAPALFIAGFGAHFARKRLRRA